MNKKKKNKANTKFKVLMTKIKKNKINLKNKVNLWQIIQMMMKQISLINNKM